jgi:hypothetical protein
MGARDLLAELADLGVTVTVDGNRLVIRPASRLTDELRASLRAHKAELLTAATAPRDDTMTAIARQLPEDARQLLSYLTWLSEDCGALPERELAKATGWPLGVVLGASKALLSAGLVVKNNAGLQPSRKLLGELNVGGATP